MKFVYLPLSVSHPSIVWDEDRSEVAAVLRRMKGTKIIINVGEEELDGFAKGHYLPICILENRWDSWEEYIGAMRSGYRRRIRQALEKGKCIQYRELPDNRDFTDEMYGLYEQVFDHSEYSLEKLTADFFRNDIAKTILLEINGSVEAFLQLIEDRGNDMLIFEFCGYNYEVAHDYDLYYNMLAKITRYAIENHFRYVQSGSGHVGRRDPAGPPGSLRIPLAGARRVRLHMSRRSRQDPMGHAPLPQVQVGQESDTVGYSGGTQEERACASVSDRRATIRIMQ